MQENEEQTTDNNRLVARGRVHLAHHYKFKEDEGYPGVSGLSYFGCAVKHVDGDFVLIAASSDGSAGKSWR